MKTRASLLIAMFAMMVGAFAQKPSMTLTFTADSNGQHVPLYSILIENLTQGGDTTLYAPDTVLVLDYVAGIDETEINRNDVFVVSQNYPNPMQGKTKVNFYQPENGDVLISISDILGRELIRQGLRLNRGNHSFTFFPGKESLYFLTAWVNHQSQTIKMINNPSRADFSGTCSLEYNGEVEGTGAYKSGISIDNLAFKPGDQLKFTSITDLGGRVITSSPTGDKTYYFHFTGNTCSDAPTVTDIDGNVYNIMLIGNQCWMKENLKTNTYRNGVPIPKVANDNAWTNLTTGAYVWNENDIDWKDEYGALYNWYAAVDPNGICPAGWHVPDHSDWTQLTNFIGGTGTSINGKKLKSCRHVNSLLDDGCNTSIHPRWDYYSASIYGTDEYGFSGLPGGSRDYTGLFYSPGPIGLWWTSSESPSGNGRSIYLSHHWDLMYWDSNYKQSGYSIRCLRNSAAPAAAFTADPTSGTAPLTVNFTDQSANNPTSWHWNFGDGNISAQQNPVHSYNTFGNYTVQLTVTYSYGSFTEIKYNYITVIYSGGPGEPCPGMPTITDIDGNVYNTIVIGSQCWMKENLKTTTYRNGTPVPNVTDHNAWYNLSTGAYVWYGNQVGWKDSYGALYNWYTIVDTNGLCPTGWRLPTDDEWTILTNHIGGIGQPNGNKLKSCRQMNSPLGGGCNTSEHPRWNQYSIHYGTDDYGFSGLPGGYRDLSGAFIGIGYNGHWWSSTEASSISAWLRSLYYANGSVNVNDNNKRNGFSIRCFRDN